MTPASCSPITVDSFGLDAIRVVFDHEHPNADPGDQMVQCRIEADEPLNSIPSLNICSDHAPDLDANYQPKSIGCQVIQNPLRFGTHSSTFCPPDNIKVAVTVNQNIYGHDPGSVQGMPNDSGLLEDQAQ
ncbi:hypothetical protein Nepgr_006714 [Nepenthes gracilis]|uniref:Uncharacterized protein n=1 Tax=Nepenthes gracilis TaxID=150966 RepID=A0AAD3XHM0_NEPGR|nr:hypothetical protein Nepgr_006714 [Nepenthes gracilis]